MVLSVNNWRDYFDRRRNKLPIEPIMDTNKEFL